ncbi:hypothetical protein FG93_04317 [Bosea sp. LC85]|uniref:hypothetical protein n=1 Tax=Bosea sp. LC85 TaxID=1502851 RepID=UPI0004E45B2C|nr:hypothetical protein [Bosea sp. LC85]KFC66835.1 hypothetical protein FG93_04317 [Bosea sp. LC85]
MSEKRESFAVAKAGLPADYPTHAHSPRFWEELGRTVATFGFLEEVLGKAIFAFTATRSYPEDEIEAAYAKWLPTLERALSDALGSLISSYGNAVKAHGEAKIVDIDHLLADLREASNMRNVLCHGSWRMPDAQGKSLPLFVNREKEFFKTPVDEAHLRQVRQQVVDLICAVIDTVTRMGWQFPGSSGPGVAIFQSSRA